MIGIAATFASCITMERRAHNYIARLPAPRYVGDTITEADLAALPEVVQRYLRYSQVVGKPRIDSFGFAMEGRIRQTADGPWMPIVSRQYNLLSEPARIYYIVSPGTPMSGIDSYLYGEGRMHIRLFNLIPVANVRGPEMDASALVTFLNDLIVCPIGYFSVPVEWQGLSDTQATVSLSNRGTTVSATLTFADDGRLLNWESNDRYVEIGGKQLPDRWSTPMTEHAEVNGLRIPVAGSGIHDYDGSPYTYVELDRIHNLRWGIRTLPPAPALWSE